MMLDKGLNLFFFFNVLLILFIYRIVIDKLIVCFFNFSSRIVYFVATHGLFKRHKSIFLVIVLDLLVYLEVCWLIYQYIYWFNHLKALLQSLYICS